MILADKIIRLRKKNGWSQEDLAQQMNVTRQSVSKWEGAQSIPDLEKILYLANLFGVTTDYLLKDELEDTEYTTEDSAFPEQRKVSMQEANEYLSLRQTAAKRIAIATFLCILAPICLLVLAGASETQIIAISEGAAIGIGMIMLLLLVTVAVVIYLVCGSQNEPFEFLEKEAFETEYGVSGMVRERKTLYRDTYMKTNIIGACFCILSPASLFVGSFLYDDNEFFLMVMLAITMFLAGIGVMFFIIAGVQWESMQKLLQEGEYTPNKKKRASTIAAIASIYWLIITAIYLGWSFYTQNWEESWIIWPVAGVLFAAVMAISSLIHKKEDHHS